MSYDVYLTDPVTKERLETDERHHMKGGTYQWGGTADLWLNVTYNYAPFFDKVLDKEKGIRFIYGLTGAESIPVLERAINALGNDISDNYWDATEGNAKRALLQLVALAKMRPDGVWDGD